MNEILERLRIKDHNNIIALPDNQGLHFFDVIDIIRCKSDNSYTEVYLDHHDLKVNNYFKVVVSRGFDEFHKFLSEKGNFFRIHNQHIVNVNYISKFINNDGGYLMLKDNTIIPIARARKAEFIKYLKEKKILL